MRGWEDRRGDGNLFCKNDSVDIYYQPFNIRTPVNGNDIARGWLVKVTRDWFVMRARISL